MDSFDFSSDSDAKLRVRLPKLPAVNVSAQFGGGLPPSATITVGGRK